MNDYFLIKDNVETGSSDIYLTQNFIPTPLITENEININNGHPDFFTASLQISVLPIDALIPTVR